MDLRRETLTLRTGLPGSGKSWSAVRYIVDEWIPNHRGPVYTNLPLNIEEIVRYCARGRGEAAQRKRQEIRERIHLIPQEVDERWDNWHDKEYTEEEIESEGPVGYFNRLSDGLEEGTSALAGALIILDEAGKKWPSQATDSSRKSAVAILVRWLATLRHEGARLVLLCQNQNQIAPAIRRLAAIEFQVLNRNSEPEHLTGTAIEDWMQLWAKLTGFYIQWIREVEYRNESGVFAETKSYTRWLTRVYFPLYRSHSRDGGGTGAEEKQEWERFGWFRLVLWVFSRNWFAWSWRAASVVLLILAFTPPVNGASRLLGWFMHTLPEVISSGMKRTKTEDKKQTAEKTALQKMQAAEHQAENRVAAAEKTGLAALGVVLLDENGVLSDEGIYYAVGEKFPLLGRMVKLESVDVRRSAAKFGDGSVLRLSRNASGSRLEKESTKPLPGTSSAFGTTGGGGAAGTRPAGDIQRAGNPVR